MHATLNVNSARIKLDRTMVNVQRNTQLETSLTNNSSFQNYPYPNDHTIQTTDTPI